jgi:SOS-response transcriptional repressor LexA
VAHLERWAKKEIMGWATLYIEKLKQGETVQFRPRGNSMTGKIESGDLCTVAPAKKEELEVGDIVLCKVGGAQYLHLIKAKQGERFQIGNNRGRINGWIGLNGIYGRCMRIEK